MGIFYAILRNNALTFLQTLSATSNLALIFITIYVTKIQIYIALTEQS